MLFNLKHPRWSLSVVWMTALALLAGVFGAALAGEPVPWNVAAFAFALCMGAQAARRAGSHRDRRRTPARAAARID